MKLSDPNLLLAVTTLSALLLLLTTSTLFATPEPWWRYLAAAAVVVPVYLLLSRFTDRWFRAGQPRMIVPEAPATAAWAALFPLLILVAAAAPLIWPRVDYGLPVIAAGIWFGATLRSALRSLRLG